MRATILLFFILTSFAARLHGQTRITLRNQDGAPVSGKLFIGELPQGVVVDESGTLNLPKVIERRPDNVELTENDLYQIADWTFDADAHELDIIVKKQTYRLQVTAYAADGKTPAATGQKVEIVGYPELPSHYTDATGILLWRIPIDKRLSKDIQFRVNGEILPKEQVTATGDNISLVLSPVQKFQLLAYQTNEPITVQEIALNGQSYKTDASGVFYGVEGDYDPTHFDVAGYNAVEVISDGTLTQVFVRSAKSTNGENVVMVTDSMRQQDTIFIEQDFSLILDGLEIEKQYLIESSTELRAKINKLNKRLSSDSLDAKQRQQIQQYLLELEQALIQNELAYQEAQLRTQEIINEMKQNLNVQDSLNEVTTERLETAEAEREEVRAEFRKNMYIAAAVIGITGLAAILLFAFSRKLQRQRDEVKRINDKLQETTKTLEVKVEELDEERAKVSTQAAHLQEMNTEISTKNAKMTDSIRYAQTIQASILPSLLQMKRILSEFFIIYRPKDIVSGDFYWFSHLIGRDGKGRTFVAVVDCTGHGVPGAFMSIVGNELLNEIINQNGVHEPAKVLHLLNTGIHKRFRQSEYLNNDSMDVALCAIEKRDGQFVVIFAGAKRPLYHFSAEKQEVRKIRGGLKSAGGRHKKPPEFTQEEITLSEGDAIYLTTDGFADQNGTNADKIGTKHLQQKISDVASGTAKEQKRELEAFLDNHQEEAEQRDDITLFGIKF